MLEREVAGERSGLMRLRRERLVVVLYAVCAAATLAHFVHSGWMTTSGWLLRFGTDGPPQPLYAPGAYRVAIPALLRAMAGILHLHDVFLANALGDFVCTVVCILLLYGALVRSLGEMSSGRAMRWAAVGMLLAGVQFPLAWVVPWQRPETMPSAAFVAFALYCLLRARQNVTWTAALLGASFWQGFVRADVALVLGIALLVLGGFTDVLAELGSRRENALRGVAISVLAGGVQAWLQFVKFPHLSYPPGTAVMPWRSNLSFHDLQTGIIAILPVLVGASLVRRRRVDGFDTLVMAASVLYLVIWDLVGNLAEVRIFVPYMLALCVVLAKVVVRWLNSDADGGEEFRWQGWHRG